MYRSLLAGGGERWRYVDGGVGSRYRFCGRGDLARLDPLRGDLEYLRVAAGDRGLTSLRGERGRGGVLTRAR